MSKTASGLSQRTMRTAIESAASVAELKDIVDYCQTAVEACRRTRRSIEETNEYAIPAVEAVIKAGEMLSGLARGEAGRPAEIAATVAGISDYRRALNEATLPERTARWWQTVYRNADAWPAYRDGLQDEIATWRGLLTREARRKVEDPTEPSTAEWELYHCSCLELSETLKDGSVNVIITDPPYPKEHLNCYSDLSEAAARMLKPGGLVVALAGPSYLPEVISRLGKHLRYHWTAAYLTPGGQSVQVWPRRVNSFWKVVLIYANGEYDGEWFGDVASSKTNDNAAGVLHQWGQSLSGMADLVGRFSSDGDLVVDPFVGSGTIGYAASRQGRRFIGCDIDNAAIEMAAERLDG